MTEQDYKPSAGEHPITPPPELVREWCLRSSEHETYEQFWWHIATQAARWGADQELEACCEWLVDHLGMSKTTASLRAARRPKPPSLKEQALETLNWMESEASYDKPMIETIRRALEQLPDAL